MSTWVTSIPDWLHDVRPTVVLMNPPFSATPGVDRIRHDADLRHVRSAFSMLPPGGRLVTIVSAGCVPGQLPEFRIVQFAPLIDSPDCVAQGFNFASATRMGRPRARQPSAALAPNRREPTKPTKPATTGGFFSSLLAVMVVGSRSIDP